ncbi:MAG: hypothetical protein JSS93_12860 [Bacteroidetes bacterium]|nr:hypothetical protein [Bacteroidota bacterium]
MNRKTSINIKPAVIIKSEAHNERRVNLNYILKGFEGHHEHWKTDTISSRLSVIKDLYYTRVGQRMQPNSSPIREGLAVIKAETTMQDLQRLASVFASRFGIECFQIHIHRDEGHILTSQEAVNAEAMGVEIPEVGTPIINHHAHMIFDWQDKTNGKSIKLSPADTREMQTITAQVLGMERGQANSKAVRLEAKEFKVMRQMLNEHLCEDLTIIEKRKLEALKELEAIEAQKKNLLPSLKVLETEMKNMSDGFSESTKNYSRTLKSLRDSRIEKKRLDQKFALVRQLESLPWSSCDSSNIQAWLSKKSSLPNIEIKVGQDGSIYFKKGEEIARLKDMLPEIRKSITDRISKDSLLHQTESLKGIKKLRQRRI